MKRWLKLATLATGMAVFLTLTLGASAFARGGPPMQQANPPALAQNYTGERNWGGPEYSLVAVAAKVLGMSQADLIAQLDSKTIAEVAKAKGVATEKIVDAFIASREEALKSAVTAGRLTQAQADQMLATMKANVTAQLNNSWTPRGQGGGRGLGFVDENNDGICDYRQ